MGNLFNKERLKIFGWYKRERTKLEKWYELNEKVRFGLVGFANMAMRCGDGDDFFNPSLSDCVVTDVVSVFLYCICGL